MDQHPDQFLTLGGPVVSSSETFWCLRVDPGGRITVVVPKPMPTRANTPPPAWPAAVMFLGLLACESRSGSIADMQNPMPRSSTLTKTDKTIPAMDVEVPARPAAVLTATFALG